jgi:hypothetical protein
MPWVWAAFAVWEREAQGGSRKRVLIQRRWTALRGVAEAGALGDRLESAALCAAAGTP